jgi:hypothetical protein
MNGYDGSWDRDFPVVMQFVDLDNCYAKPWTILEEHPNYDAAKNHEDRTVALSLVHSFLKTPENQAQLLYSFYLIMLLTQSAPRP